MNTSDQEYFIFRPGSMFHLLRFILLMLAFSVTEGLFAAALNSKVEEECSSTAVEFFSHSKVSSISNDPSLPGIHHRHTTRSYEPTIIPPKHLSKTATEIGVDYERLRKMLFLRPASMAVGGVAAKFERLFYEEIKMANINSMESYRLLVMPRPVFLSRAILFLDLANTHDNKTFLLDTREGRAQLMEFFSDTQFQQSLDKVLYNDQIESYRNDVSKRAREFKEDADLIDLRKSLMEDDLSKEAGVPSRFLNMALVKILSELYLKINSSSSLIKEAEEKFQENILSQTQVQSELEKASGSNFFEYMKSIKETIKRLKSIFPGAKNLTRRGSIRRHERKIKDVASKEFLAAQDIAASATLINTQLQELMGRLEDSSTIWGIFLPSSFTNKIRRVSRKMGEDFENARFWQQDDGLATIAKGHLEERISSIRERHSYIETDSTAFSLNLSSTDFTVLKTVFEKQENFLKKIIILLLRENEKMHEMLGPDSSSSIVVTVE